MLAAIGLGGLFNSVGFTQLFDQIFGAWSANDLARGDDFDLVFDFYHKNINA
jgi:hypothetical protein